MARLGTLTLAAATLAMLAAGCQPPCPKTAAPVEQVVAEYNANAAKVPQLWARANIELTLVDNKGRAFSWGTMLGASNGVVLLAKSADPLGPGDFVLVAKESGRPLFKLGTSTADKLYYIWYMLGETGGAWYGSLDKAGAPGTESLLLDPLGLVSLLCITELPAEPGKLPAVAMTLCDTFPYAYVVTYIDRQPVSNRVLFKREIFFTWSDTEPRRPFQVNFIAPDGRRIMTAHLSDYKPIAGTGGKDSPAVMPTDIVLEEVPWPGRVSHLRKIHLRLSSLEANHDADPIEAAKFWENLPGALRQAPVSIDEPADASKEKKAP